MPKDISRFYVFYLISELYHNILSQDSNWWNNHKIRALQGIKKKRKNTLINYKFKDHGNEERLRWITKYKLERKGAAVRDLTGHEKKNFSSDKPKILYLFIG